MNNIKGMNKLILNIAIVSSIIGFSCSESKTEQNKVEETIKKEPSCVFSVDKETVKLSWTAYKFNDKVPVGGVFEMMELDNTIESENPLKTFEKATISINTRTVNSKNNERDEKIKNSFFGTMNKTDFITGKIISINGDVEGQANIAITINNVEKEQKFDWKLENNKVEFVSELNLENWDSKPSLDSLNNVCKELHKGSDGSSVLWSTVEVVIVAELKKEC